MPSSSPDILPDLSFGTINGESIERAVKQIFPDSEINVKDEAQNIIDEYKALDNVTLDKQSIGIGKIKVIVDEEAVNIVSQNIIEEVDEVKEVSNINVI